MAQPKVEYSNDGVALCDVPVHSQLDTETSSSQVAIPPQPPDRLSSDDRSAETSRTLTPRRLTKPIAIPAARSKPEAPFLRAYPPVLSTYDISQTQFLEFLDRLNEVKIGIPPLRVLGEIAGVVGVVPEFTAQMISMGVEIAANIGHYATGETRAEMMIHKLNEEWFKPKGLKMEMMKLGALARRAGMKHLVDEKGKLSSKAQLLDPIEDIVRDESLSTQQRRLRMLDPWIERLELVPTDKATTGGRLKRLEAKAVNWMQSQYEKDMKRRRVRACSEYRKEISRIEDALQNELSQLQSKEEDVRLKHKSDPGKLERKLKSIEKDRFELMEEHSKDTKEAESDRKEYDEEQEEMKDLLFLMIRNLEADEDPWWKNLSRS